MSRYFNCLYSGRSTSQPEPLSPAPRAGFANPDPPFAAPATARQPSSASLHQLPPLCSDCGLPASLACPSCQAIFCDAHLYRCSDCNSPLCAACLDGHLAEDHWSDSLTTAELHHSHQLAPPPTTQLALSLTTELAPPTRSPPPNSAPNSAPATSSTASPTRKRGPQ
jgi:hypothetical protein